MFAKNVFQCAGWLGMVELLPLLFRGPAKGSVEEFVYYYGFLGITLAWQLAFLVIATDPGRYRLVMVPAIIEKASFVTVVAAAAILLKHAQQYILFAGIDFVWFLLFIASYRQTIHNKRA